MPVDLDKIKEQYSNLQNLNIPTPQPIPYRIPNAYGATSMQYNAGMTAAQQMRSFANMPTPQMSRRAMGYDSAIANQVGSLATNYEDIVNARSVEAGGTIGSIGGAVIGGTIGGVAGPGGMMSGASTGSFLGGMAGGVLNAIPGIGHAMRGWQRWRHGGAMQQMAGMNQIQQGLFGNVSLGGEDAGAGGMGINPMAAHGLMSKLGTTAGGGFNQSLAKITSMAGQTGFLDSATNIDQIAGTVKKLVSVMGEVAKLTGDPSFRNNMKELANMKDMGLSIDQSVQALKDLRMHGRMAGGHRFAQQGAMQGAQMFQAAGLTQGVGAQVGGAMAGVANAAMGGFTDIQRGLYQGKEGVTTALTAATANFMGNTSGLVLPYVVERGPDGKMRINQEKLQAVQSGKIGLQQLAADGAGNVARMGFRGAQDLLNAAPELKTEMTQKLGGIGAFTTMANMGLGLMKSVPGMTLETAMTTVNRGDQIAGNMMASMMRNPEMIEKMKAQVEEQKKRASFEAREQYKAIKDTETSAFGRTMRGVGHAILTDLNPFARSDANEAAQQSQEAWEQAREQQKASDEAVGVERVIDKSITGKAGKEDLDIAMQRIGGKQNRGLRKRARASRGRAGGAYDVYGNAREQSPLTADSPDWMKGAVEEYNTGPRELSKRQMEAANLMAGTDAWYRKSLETMSHGVLTEDLSRKIARYEVAGAKEGGEAIAKMRTLTSEQFERGDENIRSSISKMQGMSRENGTGAMVAMRGEAIAFAREMGSAGKGIHPKELLAKLVDGAVRGGRMTRSQADAFVNKNKDMLERQAYHWIADSGNKDAAIALNRTEGAAGIARSKMNVENIEKDRENLTKDLNKTLHKLGFAGSSGNPTTEELDATRGVMREKDVETRALAMIVGGTKDANVDDATRKAIEKAIEPYENTEAGRAKLKRARALSASMTAEQRERLAKKWGPGMLAGKSSVKKVGEAMESGLMLGEGGESGVFKGLGNLTQLDYATAVRKSKGLETQEYGEGAGVKTAASESTTKALDAQSEMLDTMAKNMNKASTALLAAADKLEKDSVTGKLMPWPF